MSDVHLDISRTRQRGRFHIDIAPAEAFKLFTAQGERLWVPGWAPEILGPLPQHPGLVFLTKVDTELTIWTVIQSDPDAGRVVYSRVTPGSRAGTVTVQVKGSGQGADVEVAYDLTALSASGKAALEAYSPSRFAKMMEDWRELILAMPAEHGAALASLLV